MSELQRARQIIMVHITLIDNELKTLAAAEKYELCAELVNVKKGLQYGIEACDLVNYLANNKSEVQNEVAE